MLAAISLTGSDKAPFLKALAEDMRFIEGSVQVNRAFARSRSLRGGILETLADAIEEMSREFHDSGHPRNLHTVPRITFGPPT